MKFIRNVPMSMCGLSLALATLGNLLRPHGEAIRYALGVLSAAVLILLVLKIILDFPRVREELRTPLPLSVLPNTTMTLMMLCVYARPYLGDAAVAVWHFAVMAHALIMLLFFKRFVLGFRLDTVLPSWFVVFVGIAAVSVTAPYIGAVPIGQVAFYIGFVLYFVALAFVTCRMAKIGQFPEPVRPTLAIFAAPMSLLTIGNFNSFILQGQPNYALFLFLLVMAAASYVFVTINMFFLLRVKFYPTYASFSFPYVASATAFGVGAYFLAERGFHFLAPVVTATMWIAVAIVAYVLVRYIMFFRFQRRF